MSQHTKLEVPSFTDSKDMTGGQIFKTGHVNMKKMKITCQTWLGPKFRGHVTENDEFQKSDQLNFRYCPVV